MAVRAGSNMINFLHSHSCPRTSAALVVEPYCKVRQCLSATLIIMLIEPHSDPVIVADTAPRKLMQPENPNFRSLATHNESPSKAQQLPLNHADGRDTKPSNGSSSVNTAKNNGFPDRDERGLFAGAGTNFSGQVRPSRLLTSKQLGIRD